MPPGFSRRDCASRTRLADFQTFSCTAVEAQPSSVVIFSLNFSVVVTVNGMLVMERNVVAEKDSDECRNESTSMAVLSGVTPSVFGNVRSYVSTEISKPSSQLVRKARPLQKVYDMHSNSDASFQKRNLRSEGQADCSVPMWLDALVVLKFRS